MRRPLLVDTALTLASAAAVLLAMTALDSPQARPVSPYGYLLGIAIAAPILVRRRAPRATLLASTAILMTYYGLEFPGFSPFLALAVPLYTVAVTGHLRTGAAVAALVTVLGVLFRAVEIESVLRSLPGTLTDTALIVGSLLLGDVVRARRFLRRELADGLRRAVREAERESERRVMTERLDIARELHDVLAHGIAVIGVQANVAAELFDSDPVRARTAVETIRVAGEEALADLANTIRVLRVGADTEPPPGLDSVATLIDGARRAGLAVELTVTGEPRPLRPAVDATAYRVIQESLTNVIRHSRASRAGVEIVYQPSGVRIRVTDNGAGSGPGSPAAGHGLIGMRERVTALRGEFSAGNARDGGFAVAARLPLGR